MKLKLTKEVAQSFTNLRGQPDFERVLTWLRENREKLRDDCSAADGTLLYRAQGAVAVVDDILNGHTEAPQLTEKFKNQQ